MKEDKPLSEKRMLHNNSELELFDVVKIEDVASALQKVRKELCREYYENPNRRVSSMDRISIPTILEVLNKHFGVLDICDNLKEINELNKMEDNNGKS